MVVVKKRINARVMKQDRGKMDNPPPGTVVDDVITCPEWCVWVGVCVHACMYMCKCVCVCVCVYIYVRARLMFVLLQRLQIM